MAQDLAWCVRGPVRQPMERLVELGKPDRTAAIGADVLLDEEVHLEPEPPRVEGRSVGARGGGQHRRATVRDRRGESNRLLEEGSLPLGPCLEGRLEHPVAEILEHQTAGLGEDVLDRRHPQPGLAKDAVEGDVVGLVLEGRAVVHHDE